ncbi:MAG: hypothetical protein ACJ743_03620 [Gaiellaceae bacterium]
MPDHADRTAVELGAGLLGIEQELFGLWLAVEDVPFELVATGELGVIARLAVRRYV